jgi:ubiquinol-cytochrome c reductase cytochrome b subunit
VWLWGPFGPSLATSPAQPDWYIGWLEGALRLYPPWEFRVFGYLVPSPFIPGIVLPALTFAVIYCWPWIDRRLTGDRGAHHVLDRPRNRPVRVAVGVWALWFYGLLLLAGANDIIARLLRVPLLGVLWTMRIAVIVVPLLAGALAWWVARRLRDSRAATLAMMTTHDLLGVGGEEPGP